VKGNYVPVLVTKGPRRLSIKSVFLALIFPGRRYTVADELGPSNSHQRYYFILLQLPAEPNPGHSGVALDPRFDP
jgi:hypothetical protein